MDRWPRQHGPHRAPSGAGGGSGTGSAHGRLPLARPAGAGEPAPVLVLEDNSVVALDLAAALEEAGLGRALVAHDVDAALGLIAGTPIRAGVLDVDLGGVSAMPVARALRDRGRPFIFATGSDRSALSEFPDAAVLVKPFAPAAMVAALRAAGAGP